MFTKEIASKSDLMFFQNDILADIKKFETTINNKLSQLTESFDQKISENESKYTKLSENVNELISIYANRKHDNEKIEQYLEMHTKLMEQIQDSRNQLIFLSSNLDSAICKYDRIFSDNLEAPGIVGNSIGAKFRNMKLFIEFVYAEIKNFKLFKDQQIINTKSYKEKLDTLIKKIEIGLKEVSTKTTNICNQKFTEYEKIMDERCNITEEIVKEQKIENSKNALDLINKTKELSIQWDKMENIKNDVNEILKKELKKFKAEVENNTRIFTSNQSDYKILKQRFTQLCEFIKDIRFQKNLVSKSVEFKKMAKKIDFNQKQKIKADYDTNKIYDKIGNNVANYLNQGLKDQEKISINNIETKRRSSVIVKNTDKSKFEKMNIPIIDSSPLRRRVNKKQSVGIINIGDINKFKNQMVNESNDVSPKQIKLISTLKHSNNDSHSDKEDKDESSHSSYSSSSIGTVSVSSSNNKSSVNNNKTNDNIKKTRSKINEKIKNDKEDIKEKEKETPKTEDKNINTAEISDQKDNISLNKKNEKKREEYANKIKLQSIDFMVTHPSKRQSANLNFRKTQTNISSNILNNNENKFLQPTKKFSNGNKITDLKRNLINNNSNSQLPFLNNENQKKDIKKIINNKDLKLNTDSKNSNISPILKKPESRLINLRNNSVDQLRFSNSNQNTISLDNAFKNFYRTDDKILKNSSITYIKETKTKNKNYKIQKSQNLSISPTIIKYPTYKENVFSFTDRYKADIKQYFKNNNDIKNKEMETLEEVLEKEHYVAGLFYVTKKIFKINEKSEDAINKIKSLEEKYLPLSEQIKEIYNIINNINEYLKKEENIIPHSNLNTKTNVMNSRSLSNFNCINSSKTIRALINKNKTELNNNHSKIDLNMISNRIMKNYQTKNGGINLNFHVKKDGIRNLYLRNDSKNSTNKDTFNIININNSLIKNFSNNNITSNINNNNINNSLNKIHKINRPDNNHFNTISSCNAINDEWRVILRKIEPFLVKKFAKDSTK